jgi:signal transduction histidine kinase
MIQNDDELSLVRRQLERAEAALASLKRDVLPKSEARFNLMSETYFDQIVQLRREIDEYRPKSLASNEAAKQQVRPQGAA